MEAVKASFDEVERLRAPKLNPLQPVGTVAAIMGHMPVLQFALDKGASVEDRDLAFAIQKGAKKSAEMKDFYEKDKQRLDDIVESLQIVLLMGFHSSVPLSTIRSIDHLW